MARSSDYGGQAAIDQAVNEGGYHQQVSVQPANVVVVPNEKLVFASEDTSQGSAKAHLVIHNPTDQSVIYKFKTNANRAKVSVSPCIGHIHPGEHVDVGVCLNFADRSDIDDLKILVVTAPAPQFDNDLKSVWKQIAAENQSITKVKCVVNVPAPSSVEEVVQQVSAAPAAPLTAYTQQQQQQQQQPCVTTEKMVLQKVVCPPPQPPQQPSQLPASQQAMVVCPPPQQQVQSQQVEQTVVKETICQPPPPPPPPPPPQQVCPPPSRQPVAPPPAKMMVQPCPQPPQPLQMVCQPPPQPVQQQPQPCPPPVQAPAPCPPPSQLYQPSYQSGQQGMTTASSSVQRPQALPAVVETEEISYPEGAVACGVNPAYVDMCQSCIPPQQTFEARLPTSRVYYPQQVQTQQVQSTSTATASQQAVNEVCPPSPQMVPQPLLTYNMEQSQQNTYDANVPSSSYYGVARQPTSYFVDVSPLAERERNAAAAETWRLDRNNIIQICLLAAAGIAATKILFE